MPSYFARVTRSGVPVVMPAETAPSWVQFGADPVIPLPQAAWPGLDLVAADVSGTQIAVLIGSDDYGYLAERRPARVRRCTPGKVHGRYSIQIEPDGEISWVPHDNPYVVRYSDGRPETPSRDTQHPLSPDPLSRFTVAPGIVVTQVVRSGRWTLGEWIGAPDGVTVLYAHDGARGYEVWRGYAPLPSFIVEHPDGTATVAVTTPRGINAPLLIPSSAFRQIVVQAPPVPPPPSTSTSSRVRLARRCFERKKLVGWYHAFNERSDYPSADPSPDRYPGNVAMATTPVELTKAGALPLIQTPEIGVVESELGRTLAYYAHGTDTIEGGRAIYQQALDAPPKPVIWYLLDARNYAAALLPDTLPAWVDRDRTWISVQLYRDAGESMEACRDRWHAILAKAHGWGLPLCPTIQFFDRNGTMPLADVRATMDITEDALRAYEDDTIGWLAFGWGRPGGVVTHPELLEDAWSFYYAVPGRPNRFDGWLSSNWIHDLFSSKVRYSTPMFRAEEIEVLQEAGRAIGAL